MHTPNLAARLIHESDVLQGCWDEYQGHEGLPIVAAALLLQIPEGLDRLSKAWILDRLDIEERIAH